MRFKTKLNLLENFFFDFGSLALIACETLNLKASVIAIACKFGELVDFLTEIR